MAIDAGAGSGDDLSVKWINPFAAFLCLAIVPCLAAAQSPRIPGESLHVYLITLGPGSDPWEKFGHDFIDVEDPSRQLLDPVNSNGDPLPPRISYNWGVFDFGNGISGFASFGWHFLRGRLEYSMQGYPTDAVVDTYTRTGRYVLKQELNFTPAEKIELLNRLMQNDTDANRYYLYDYFQKNCSTMTRDAIDRTVDGRIHEVLSNVPTGTTLRWHDRRCTADDLWLYLFLDYALGHAVDQPLSAWSESFLPMKLAGHLRDVKVKNAEGKFVPLILSETVLSTGTYPSRDVPPAGYFYGFLSVGVVTAALLFLLARWASMRAMRVGHSRSSPACGRCWPAWAGLYFPSRGSPTIRLPSGMRTGFRAISFRSPWWCSSRFRASGRALREKCRCSCWVYPRSICWRR